MNQGAGSGSLQTRGRPKGRAQRQTSSGRGGSTHTGSFPYFLLRWKKEGDASLLWPFICFRVQKRKPPPRLSHTLCYHF